MSWRVVLALLATFVSSGALADERILDYRIEVRIERDGALDVTERIKVRAEGNQIRRGIYRDFPTRYFDRFGNRVVVDLDVLGVLRDDRPEPWFTEDLDNGVRINTGNDDFLPVPAEYTFTLRYRTTRQLGFFADHDELYWNAIGTGWAFRIERGTVDVHLPEPVAVERLSAEGYTGYQGDQGQDYRARIVEPGHARWQLTRQLMPREGFTIVLSFPKGLIPPPSLAQRFIWLLKDNRAILVGLLGLALLIVYCVREWSRVGRDPDKGVIIARYEPPAGHTPASLRFLLRMGYDMRCFSSDVLALAVAGCVRIVRDKGLFKDEWRLERTAVDPPSDASHGQRVLLATLFKSKPTLVLKNTSASTLSAAQRAHTKAIDGVLHPRYYEQNKGSVRNAVLIAAGGGLLALWLAGESAKLAVMVVIGLMVITVIVFGRLVKAPTLEGRKLLDEIEGLKLYLSVAERNELARMQGPGAPPALDAKRYETLLPFAVALEVEDAWTDKFTAAVGAAAAAEATRRIGWYHGGSVGDLGSLSRAVGSSLTSQIASSSKPPGSSSGSGGGGSSGGGGGGGGGGGR